MHKQTRGVASRCLLETTAGQGSTLGWKFEHLATIIDGVKDPDRLGVCVDTCHIFAAGYPLATEKEYQATMQGPGQNGRLQDGEGVSSERQQTRARARASIGTSTSAKATRASNRSAT